MTDRWGRDPSRLVKFDSLDVPLERAIEGSSRPPPRSALRQRLGLRWSPTSIPVALLLLLGIGLGPQGVNLLALPVLAFLDPVMPVALAVFGTLLGLAVGARRFDDRRWLAMASAEPLITVAVVAIGTTVTPAAALAAPGVPVLTLGLFAGVCAATSLGIPTGNPSAAGTQRARATEFGAALLIVVGGLLLASVRESSLLATISLAGQACAVAVVLATAGRLLLTQTSSNTEQRVITLATLMLVGGASGYLALSPLLGGLVAGVVWQRAGGPALEWMRRDALYVQHPLLVMLLLVAGARVEPTTAALGLAGAYALLRCVGGAAGESLIRRFAGTGVRHDLGQHLARPGLLGVALALDALRAVGSDMSVLVTVIVIGTIGSELLGGFLERHEAAE